MNRRYSLYPIYKYRYCPAIWQQKPNVCSNLLGWLSPKWWTCCAQQIYLHSAVATWLKHIPWRQVPVRNFTSVSSFTYQTTNSHQLVIEYLSGMSYKAPAFNTRHGTKQKNQVIALCFGIQVFTVLCLPKIEPYFWSLCDITPLRVSKMLVVSTLKKWCN